MKIRDLGRAFLDFELNKIPRASVLAISLILGLLFGTLRWIVSLYKALWFAVIVVSFISLYVGLEKDCTKWCYGLIELNYQGYALKEEYLYSAVVLIVAIPISFLLDKKFNEISAKFFPKDNA